MSKIQRRETRNQIANCRAVCEPLVGASPRFRGEISAESSAEWQVTKMVFELSIWKFVYKGWQDWKARVLNHINSVK
jgi:hypothetical protein